MGLERGGRCHRPQGHALHHRLGVQAVRQPAGRKGHAAHQSGPSDGRERRHRPERPRGRHLRPARRGANRPPPVRINLVDASGRNGGRSRRNHVRKLPFFLRRKLEKIAHGRYMHALPVGLGKPASEPANSSESGVPKPAVRPLWGPHIRLTRTISRRRLTPPRIALLHEILCANRPNQRNSLGRSAADTPTTPWCAEAHILCTNGPHVESSPAAPAGASPHTRGLTHSPERPA